MRCNNQRRRIPVLVVLASLCPPLPHALAETAGASPVVAHTEVFPQPPPTPEQVGDAFMYHQRYQAAIEAYKKSPLNSSKVWNMMGVAYQMLFNLKDATRCYETSLKIAPGNPHVLNNLGTIYDMLKDFGAAERLYRKALKIDPKSALVNKNLGTNLLAQRKYAKGWEAYQAALAIDPHIFEENDSPHAESTASSQQRGAMNYFMAKGCAHADRKDRAIEYLRMAINEGFTTPKKVVADSEFSRLRGQPAFEKLLAGEQPRGEQPR